MSVSWPWTHRSSADATFPAATLTRLATALGPVGVMVVSLYRWGNAPAIWRRLGGRFLTTATTEAPNGGGDKTWDIRMLQPLDPNAVLRP